MAIVVSFQAVILVAIAAALWFLPQAVEPSIAFGVRIPPAHRKDVAVVAATRGYRLGLVAGTLICLASLFLIRWPPWAPSDPIMIFIGLFVGNYLVARHQVLVAKQSGQWFSGAPQGAAAATNPDSGQGPFPWPYLLPALIVLALTLIIGVARYPELPARIATHFSLTGTVTRYTAKGWGSALFPVWVQLFLTGLIAILAFFTWRSPRQLDPAHPETSLQRSWQFRTRMIRMLLLLAAAVDLTLLLSGLLVWGLLPADPFVSALIVLIPVLTAASVVTVSFRMGQEGVRIPAPDTTTTGLIARDDDRLWKAGLIYWNPQDPAIIVPKRFGIGWTFNFGH